MNQLPAHLQNRQRRNLTGDAVAGINVGQGPHISISGNRFTLVDGAGNEKPVPTFHLDVNIIDLNRAVSKIFFDPSKPYDPSSSEGAAPICFSDNGVGASARASFPQSQSCAACQWNAWGSATSKMTGKQTKACNDVKKIAVVVPGESVVFMLRVPPASLKNLAQYSATVQGHGVDLPDVLTRVEFESQGVLKFSPVGYVDEQTAVFGDAALAAQATIQMLGKNDTPWDGQQRQAPQLAAAPQQVALPPPVQQSPFMASPAPQFMPPPAQVQQSPFMASPAPQFMPPPAQVQQPGPFAAPTAPAFPPVAAGPAMSAPSPSASPEPPKVRKPRTPKAAQVPAPKTPPFMDAQQPAAPVAAQAAPSSFFAAPPAAAPSFTALTTGAPPAPQNGIDTSIPPFLQKNQGPVAPPQPAAQQNFNMVPNPPAPDAGMQDALDAAFSLPTPGVQ